MSENMSAKIAQLQQRYRDSLPLKRKLIIEVYSRIRASVTERNVERDAYKLLHRLAGSAGMYEYHGIARAARDAILLIESESDGEQLEASLQKLIGEINQNI
jgi:hypothetical protein